MNLHDSIGRFIDTTASEYMPEVASQLLELLEADEVEALGNPGDPVSADEIADRLENRVQRIRRRSDDVPEGLDLIEDAVAHLRSCESQMLAPWTFEDGDGIRWFILADGRNNVVACYTSAPFVEADA